MRNGIILIILFSLFSSCSENKIDEGLMINHTEQFELNVLEKSRIFFGHKSVGYNIIDGIRDLMKETMNENINIIELDQNQSLPEYFFLHTEVGNNGEPDKKCDDFLNILSMDLLNHLDIALLKFCYVDVQAQSDVQKIFNYYKMTMDTIKKKYPNLKLVHVTVPLSILQTGLKATLKKIIGREVGGFSANVKRNQFNDLLKEHYKNEPIFDLAKIESTYPDARRESFKHSGQLYYALIPEYTNDGGHLNKIGRRLAALELIRVLSKVIQMEVKND
jgi:hypothetical protein